MLFTQYFSKISSFSDPDLIFMWGYLIRVYILEICLYFNIKMRTTFNTKY